MKSMSARFGCVVLFTLGLVGSASSDSSWTRGQCIILELYETPDWVDTAFEGPRFSVAKKEPSHLVGCDEFKLLIKKSVMPGVWSEKRGITISVAAGGAVIVRAPTFVQRAVSAYLQRMQRKQPTQ